MNTKLVQVLQTIIELSPTSLEKIASKFSVTERTLRYQIDKINEFFEDSGVVIDLTIKKGIINISEKNSVKEFLKSLEVDVSRKDRKELLALMVLIGKECNLSNLAKELELTRNSLKNTLLDARKSFVNFDLNLDFLSDRGYVLSGEENNIRRAQYEMISKAFFRENGVLEIDKYNLFSEYFNEELRVETKYFLKRLQKEMNVTLNDNNYKIMYLYIMIVIKRVENSNNFLKKIGNENFLKTTFEFKIFQELFRDFQKKLKINVPYFDKLKIFEIILGCTAILEKQDYFEDWVTLELKVKKVIKIIGRDLKVDFFKDQYLYADLINHIRPMLYRLKNGFSIKNTEIEEFKIQNYDFFKVVEKIVVEEFSLDKDEVQDECIFIAIHFKVAKDRIDQLYKTRKNVLIVCNFGYGTGKLIGNQIIEKFDANIMGIISFKELENMNIEKIDYIITTLNKEPFELISFPQVRIIKVSPILTKDNLERLNSLGIEFSKKQYDVSELIDIIAKYYKVEGNVELKNELNLFLNKRYIESLDKEEEESLESFFFKEEQKLDVEEAIIRSAEPLIENDFIDCLYLDEMLGVIKNNLEYIVLENGIAIPHASNKFVYKKGCSVLELNNGIQLENGMNIKKIVMFVSPEVKDYSRYYRELMIEN